MDIVTDFESDGCAFDPRRGHLLFMQSNDETKLIRLLLNRLEYVSVDSYWAHRASGIRGGLLKTLEELEKEHLQVKSTKMN